jgi:peptidoglycan LD-endopeptidase LytH
MKKIILLLAIGTLGILLPMETVIPVQHATNKDWNKDSYWFYPWGESGVHKGIDIFAKEGTPTLASTSGIVLFKGQLKRGGKVVAVLGPKWRIHYYAHLKNHHVHAFEWVKRGEKIGEVGDTGNARGKPPHLHYSMLSLIPNIGEFTLENQGWQRMFYVNPSTALAKSNH